MRPVPIMQRSILPTILLIFIGLAGCSWRFGDVPAALRIDSGMDPDNQDKYTRFRTTYYFRVIDSCRVEAGDPSGNAAYKTSTGFRERTSGKTKIVNDTVYRFRMTGKASALFNKVNFGSGVLRADQIDPFGNSVEYKNGAFEVKTRSGARQKELRDALLEEIRDLKVLHDELPDNDLGKDKLKGIIQNKVMLLNGGGTVVDEPNRNNEPPNPLCPEGRPIKKSYSLYGPEGVRELDPDERLLMAMSSDSKPLIGMLEELSGRQRKAANASKGAAKILVEEETWTADSEDKLKELKENLNKENIEGSSPTDVIGRLTSKSVSTNSLPRKVTP